MLRRNIFGTGKTERTESSGECDQHASGKQEAPDRQEQKPLFEELKIGDLHVKSEGPEKWLVTNQLTGDKFTTYGKSDDVMKRLEKQAKEWEERKLPGGGVKSVDSVMFNKTHKRA